MESMADHVIKLILVLVLALAVVFVISEWIIDWHLWELIMIPFVLVYGRRGITISTMKKLAIVDEKQEVDIISALYFFKKV